MDPTSDEAVASKRRAGILCFRSVDDVDPDAYQFLLVSRRSRTVSTTDPSTDDPETYTIPAGKFEADIDPSYEECALREAREEAGIECTLVHDLGWFASRSKHDQPISTRYFLGRCDRLLDNWQESDSRARRWFKPAEALRHVSYKQDLSEVIGKGRQALRLGFGAAGGGEMHGSLQQLTAEAEEQDAPQRTLSALSNKSDQSLGHERYMCYSHQVGGHFCMVKPMPGSRLEVELPLLARTSSAGNGGPGCVSPSLGIARSGESCQVHGSRVVLKPFDAAEERFYRHLRIDGVLAPLLAFTCLFYGTKKLRREQIETLASEGNGTASAGTTPEPAGGGVRESKGNSQNIRRYIVLEDLGDCAGKPCFLDLKVGCKQRAARHNLQKRTHMAAKAAQSTSASLGFRICGMNCYNPSSGTVQRYDKYWGQKVTKDTMSHALNMFFPVSSQHLSAKMKALIQLVIDKLDKLEATLRSLPSMRFWGSSLLIFFDAALVEQSRTEDLLRSLQVKIIDFANFETVGGDSPDMEYLCGICNIRVFLQSLLDDNVSVASQLTPPPLAELQDAEQQRAWEARQSGRRESRLRCISGEVQGVTVERNEGYSAPAPRNARRFVELSAERAEAGSGATGRQLRERRSSELLAENAETISGATGRQLQRELASYRMVRAGSGAEGEFPRTLSACEELFASESLAS